MSMYDIQKDARVPESCSSTLRYFSNCSSPLRGLGIKLYHMHIMVCSAKVGKTPLKGTVCRSVCTFKDLLFLKQRCIRIFHTVIVSIQCKM